MLFDLHVHTKISPCSELEIDDVLKHARARGLDGVCITDHQTMKIRKYLQAGPQSDGLCVIFGMEYTTADGDFLLFGPFENISRDLSAIQLLRRVRRAGGAAIAAHRNTSIENLQVENWRREYSLTYCGGSDAHSLDELGMVSTRFSTPVRSLSDLVDALKNGLCRPECGSLDNFFEIHANIQSV
jgi:predicted metal-dependent phosphoesterase TrpH